jgi:hypothetical protein
MSCLITEPLEGDERFVLRTRSKNPNIPLGRTTRASMRQHSRGTLHIDDEPAAEIQEENSGIGSDTPSDDGEESDENYQISPRGMKRSGRFMRGSGSSGGHGASSGNGGGNGGDQHGEDEEEDEQSRQPVFVTGVMMRNPSVPRDYVKVDYMKREMTVKARNEREKNPFDVRKGRSVEYRFQTKFHQDFYKSAILSNKDKVARSQYID